MGSRGATGELELVPIATSVPNVGVLYRAEHVPAVRRLVLMGSPAPLAEQIAHRAFRRVARQWEVIADPLTEVRRLSVAELLARYHPAGRAPTFSPPREGAPPAWAEAGALLDPLSPEDRVVRVLQVYDGLDDTAVDALLPERRRGRREEGPPVDLAVATRFADAVADVAPPGRLTSVLGIGLDADDDGAGTGPDRRYRVALTPRARRWVAGAAAAVVAVGLLSRVVGNDLPRPAPPSQEVLVGVGPTGGVVFAATQGAANSSCPRTDPVIGPGGTALPEEGETDPARVARVLATDRRALVALHRGGRDARIIERTGRVRRTGLGGAGRVRNIDGGDDQQIQVVIRSASDCPSSPESWKGIPLVFTTLAAASAQPDVVTAGAFADGVPWEVRDRPGHGLCASLGDGQAPCGTKAGDDELQPVRVLAGRDGRRLAFGYLPSGAASARFEWAGGELGPAMVPVEGATYFAAVSSVVEEPRRIRFFDRNGAAVTSAPYPDD